MRVFNAQIELTTQEDGLWRASVPGLRGCWVDAPTMEQAIADIQEAIAMFVDVLEERGEDLPNSLQSDPGVKFQGSIPVDVTAFSFSRPKKARAESASR